MRFADMVKLANASLWRNKSRTILTVLAIFIGAFTIMMTTGINTGVNSYIDRQVNSVGAEGYLQVMQDSTAEQMQSMMAGSTNDVKEYKATSGESGKTESFSDDDIAKIKSVAGIKRPSPTPWLVSITLLAIKPKMVRNTRPGLVF